MCLCGMREGNRKPRVPLWYAGFFVISYVRIF
ncbi:hypothetical protein VPHD51_0225 [Vibrio phage D51]